ncbi:cytochrome b/b6 domain-containing protein [Corynebacterium glaucum]|uniref:cytochrome b/b6 domain-containing protein n=1 Tax=Corynebacterium glaucum TaxID=187491 RepID=UPI00265AC56E|nr:cytochrome b/b6 domain-containing protein [Corynebacterium glaucum]
MATGVQVPVRRGLPRVQGGEPWPPVETIELPEGTLVTDAGSAATATTAGATTAEQPVETAPQGELVEVAVRRGLPRVSGGEPWPPVTSVMVEGLQQEPAFEAAPEAAAAAATASAESAAVAGTAAAGSTRITAASEENAQPAAAKQPAAAAQPAKRSATTPAEAAGKGGRKWVWPMVAAAVLLLVGVLASRWFINSATGADFIARYDGTQPLPESAPVGLPAWLGWAHFFNMFLMALIVKTGWSVRTETKPPAYWAPKNNPKAKISLTLWMHLVLDVAWIALGALFYILLFTTGQWMRIVPTSWEVIPNAVSAGIQYLSLEWPTEDPWVHYNALQELMYFAVVFLAAPLAIISGLRMSPWWPKNQKWFPMSAARAIHFPVMVFFIVFTIIHVALVALTGLRLNLNAMFASSNDASSWTGALVFLGALAAIAAAWFAAKPVLVAPVAGKFGTVSQR